MSFSGIVSTLSSWIWGMPFIILCLFTGLYFSFRTRFLQIRYIKDMVMMLFGNKASASGISSLQSFMLALSGRVGTGNIAGVATAIALGGPGAIFWMWIIAFLGAGTAYIEASLGQIYKEKIDGNYRGGPAYYILKGLKMKKYAIAFAIVTIIALGILMPGLQSNAICDAFGNAFGIAKPVTGAIVAFFLAFVIFGGVKRIAKVAEVIVPFMVLGYIIITLIVIAWNWHHIPAMFMLVLKSAFGLNEVFAGIIGAAITMGVKRGIFSNEAGQGTAPHAAAAAEVSHPAEQGFVQAFSVYIDTLLVCSATAFIILITGMYKVYDSSSNVIFDGGGLAADVHNYGPIYAQLGIDTIFRGFGSSFVAIALFFFAFTTIMSYYFQAESNIYFLIRDKKKSIHAINILRVAMLIVTFLTSIRSMVLAWDLADIGVGLMAWFNIIAILLLQKPALNTFIDYEKQKKNGIKEPIFDPQKLGIDNANEWESINIKNINNKR